MLLEKFSSWNFKSLFSKIIFQTKNVCFENVVFLKMVRNVNFGREYFFHGGKFSTDVRNMPSKRTDELTQIWNQDSILLVFAFGNCDVKKWNEYSINDEHCREFKWNQKEVLRFHQILIIEIKSWPARYFVQTESSRSNLSIRLISIKIDLSIDQFLIFCWFEKKKSLEKKSWWNLLDLK